MIIEERCMTIQVNLDMTDSMGPGKLVRLMQNLSYTYDIYLICIGLDQAPGGGGGGGHLGIREGAHVRYQN